MSLINSKKHWIFDMDGTLTVAVHDFPAIKNELGTPLDLDILTAINLMEKEAAVKTRQKLQEIELKLASISKISIGTELLLNHLQGSNCNIGILTRNSLLNTKETLRASRLDRFFHSENIITRDEAEPKPSPEGIHILLDKWKASPKDAVMVGDYIFDLEAGKRAGVNSVYVDPSGEFIFREHADFCIRHLGEVLEIK